MCWPLVGKHIFDWPSSTAAAFEKPIIPDGTVCSCGNYKIWYGTLVPIGLPEYENP